MTVLRSGSASHVGQVRTVNQDLSLESTNLYAVADGMGGHVGGEVAARVAIDSLRASFQRQSTLQGLQQAVDDANQSVWQQSQVQSDLRGMGTTLTVVALVAGDDGGDVLAVANVGDSRAYLYSVGTLTQVTVDHSLAEEKVRQGELTEEEAAVHPHRHILTRALGIATGVDVDLWEVQVRTGDRVLLCSDGLTNEVGDEAIGEVLASTADPHQAAAALVDLANANGGNDNVTALVVDVLVGEEGGPTAVIAPVAGSTAAGAVAGAAAGAGPADHAEVASAPPLPRPPGTERFTGTPSGRVVAVPPKTETGPLAPGTHVGFGDTGPATMATADVASATTSVPAAEPMAPPPPAPVRDNRRRPGESRRDHRRRLGNPRVLTFRVVLFFILFVAILVGGYFVVRWYANDNWYVALDGKQLVVYQGRPGGFWWFHPKVVDRTGVTTSQVLKSRVPELRAEVQEGSLADAQRFVRNLRAEYLSEQPVVTPTTTTTTVPGGSTTTTVPGGPTSTIVSTTTTTTVG